MSILQYVRNGKCPKITYKESQLSCDCILNPELEDDSNIISEIVEDDGDKSEDDGDKSEDDGDKSEGKPCMANTISDSEDDGDDSGDDGEENSDIATLGGVSYVVGGWGTYEVNKRKYRWHADKKSRMSIYYPGRTFITPYDVIFGIMCKHSKVLHKTLKEFVYTLRNYISRQMILIFQGNRKKVSISKDILDPDIIEDNIILYQWDSEELEILCNKIYKNLSTDKPPVLSNYEFPKGKADVNNDKEVLALEKSVKKCIREIELFHIKVVKWLNKVIKQMRV